MTIQLTRISDPAFLVDRNYFKTYGVKVTAPSGFTGILEPGVVGTLTRDNEFVVNDATATTANAILITPYAVGLSDSEMKEWQREYGLQGAAVMVAGVVEATGIKLYDGSAVPAAQLDALDQNGIRTVNFQNTVTY